MAFVFKIKLDGSAKPPIWRKVKVKENISFDDFHIIIQMLFGWEETHLYHFSPKGWRSRPYIKQDIGEYFFDEEPFSSVKTFPHGEVYDASKISLNNYFDKLKQKIVYIYDFGDDWRHIVELVEITDEKLSYSICLEGKGCNLMEDCGGIGGFYNMVEALNDPNHPEYSDYVEWLGWDEGEKWDLNYFDIESVNKELKCI